MKISIACICLCLVMASNAFPMFGDNMMRTMMFSNMMSGRQPFDFTALFGGSSTANQQQDQVAPAAGTAAQGAATTGAQQGDSNMFSNMSPILQLSLLGDGMLF